MSARLKRSSDLSATCAVGDIHGDLQKAVSLFKLAGCVEEVDRRLVWTGGNTTVVQLGDVLDRGSQEIGVCLHSASRETPPLEPFLICIDQRLHVCTS
jgi:hypothetical protein